MCTAGTRSEVRKVLALLDGAPLFEAPRLYAYDRAEVARRAYDQAALEHGTDPRDVAAALGVRVSFGRGSGPELAHDLGLVIASWNPDRRERGLRLWHGLAHVLLARER